MACWRSAKLMVLALAATACTVSHDVPMDAGPATLGQNCVDPFMRGTGCVPPLRCQHSTLTIDDDGGTIMRARCYGPLCPGLTDAECPAGFVCVGTSLGYCSLSCSGATAACPGMFRCGHSQYNYSDPRYVCAGGEWRP